MGRSPRIHYSGAIYHVMLRGNNRIKIFYKKNDRDYFYSLLAEVTKRYAFQTHAFCFMDNHIHLALQVSDIPLSTIIQNIASRYAKYINQENKRIGHLFQGRYKAILVDADQYLLELVRYIHLNPLRAKLVKELDQYRWSSHPAYLGNETLPWLTTDWVLSQFSKNKERAILSYQKFLSARTDLSLQIFTAGNQKKYDLLGDDHFLERITRVSIPRLIK